MRPRFLIILDFARSDRRGAVAKRLRCTLPENRSNSRDVLFTAADCPVVTMDAIDGWLIGSLFEESGRHPRRELQRSEQLAVLSTDGRLLTEKFSGSYLALWRGSEQGTPAALRDPAACLPAYWVACDEGIAIASDIEGLVLAGLLRLTPDPAGIALHLRFPLVPTDVTALAGVQELRPGFRTRLDSRSQAASRWRPADFAGSVPRDPASILRSIEDVVAGQHDGFSNVAVELSGGLDSSIVASSLNGDGATALHMVPAAQDGDERRYAGLVVERFQMSMHEVPIGFDDIDVLASPCRLTARPSGVEHFRGTDRKLRGGQQITGADIVFSGAGGDSVFCSLASTAPIIDAWRAAGWRQARMTLADIARILEVTHWEAFHHLIRRILTRSGRRWRWPADDSLLGPAGRAAAPPDASQLDGLLPGARAHVASVLRLQTLFDAYDRMADGDMRYPLLSQPVIEACFAVPSWQWMSGGRDRAVARAAFAHRLPPAILQRRGKGRYDTLIVASFDNNRDRMRDLLLGGWLADQKIIDVDAVEKALARPARSGSIAHARPIRLADAELWCRMVLGRQGVAGAG